MCAATAQCAIAYFVTQENIDAKGFFETGLSLNVLPAAPDRNPASVDAEGLAKGIIAKITGADTARVLKPVWEIPAATSCNLAA